MRPPSHPDVLMALLLSADMQMAQMKEQSEPCSSVIGRKAVTNGGKLVAVLLLSLLKSLLKQEHQRAVRGAVRLEACAEQPLCIKERRLFLWLRAA